MKLLVTLLTAGGIAAFAMARADGAAADLSVGDEAPGFSLPGSDGRTHTLADYRGQVVVLAWFPMAFTGG